MFQLFLLADLIVTVTVTLYTSSISPCSVRMVNYFVSREVSRDSMEAYPFKVGDYNNDVQANFPGERGQLMSLPYSDDVMAWVVIYNDKDTAFHEAPTVLGTAFDKVKKRFSHSCFNSSSIRYIEANELRTINGLTLPVVHVQTAGHAAGGAFYYQQHQITNQPDNWANRTIFGTSAHPEFGTDTRFAGVIVFGELADASFDAPDPTHYADTEEGWIRILNSVNGAFGRK